jgi:hypothetical protein
MVANKKYKATLINSCHIVTSMTYDKEHEFTNQELSAITSTDLVQWMSHCNPEPGKNDNPVCRRSSSLEHYKKVISSFIPNKLMAWNIMADQGNPTKSPQVNVLLGWV